MNDVTVVTSVTYPSPESLALVADVQYHEPYLSAALNRKFRGIVDPGFYAGFFPKPGGGMNLLITSVDGDKTAGAASVNIGEFYQVTIQQRKDISLALSAGKKYAIVLKGRYLLGEDSYQVNTASHIHAAEFVARTYTDSYQLGDGELLVCTVNIPAGVSAITKEMIDVSDRIDLAIGIEISDSVTSTRSDVAASSLAVKKAYDLAKSKYTAQDASTTQKGLVQLSSATNSDSETMAATPKAVKSVKELADTKAPIESPSLTGTPTAPTAAQGTNSTQIANTAFVKAAITALINGAPGTLDTLKEIAAAINNDPNFSTTINNALALKAPLASPALTGIPTAPTAAQGTNNTQIATTAYVRAAISALVGSSPEALDTLNELAAALGNDPNFATTMTNALAGKQPLDATLTALAALATGANKLPYFTGKDTVAQTDLTSVGRDILAKTSTLAVIQYLGLRELGTSGEKIPLLSTANTWSARQTFNGGITGALTGNADTATKLKTARTIGGVAFDGSANINLPGVNTTGNQNTTGNAATATKLATARNINGVKFDGSGDVNINTLVSRGRVTALSGSTQGTAGIQMYEAYNNSYPTTYGNVLHMKGASAAGEGELLIGWSGTSGAHAPVFIRSRRDNTDAAWSAWAQVYTSRDSIPGVNATGNQNTTGNAATATKLQTARTIGGVSFDGTANINLPGVNTTGNQNTTGNAATATKLQTARTINGVKFDGSADITLTPANLDVYSKSEIDNKKGMRKYTFSAPANAVSGKWYPIVFRRSRGSTDELASRVVITTHSSAGGYAMNNCEFNGFVMPGGWSDRGSYAAGFFSIYSTAERAIHSIISSVKDDDLCSVFYVEARAFPIKIFAEEGLNVIVPTADYAVGQTTYKWGATDPLSESTNAQIILDFKNGRGYYCSHPFISSLSGNAATATKLQTARTIGGVAFDGSANINLPGVNTAGNQNTTGNAATATKLQTARKISGVSFDGSADITLTAENVSAFALRATGTYADTSGAVPWNAESGAYNVTRSGDSYIVANFYTGVGSCRTLQIRAHHKNGGLYYRSSRDGYGFEEGWAQIYTKKDSIPGVNTTGNQNTTGNAATATKLQTARTIGGVSFDGSANINLPGVNTTGNQNTTGNAATATKLQTARNINGVPFDGTKDITLTPKDLDAYSKSEVQSALAGKQPLDNTLTNLSGKDVAGLLAYLQLGEAAKRDVGAGNNQLPDMSAFGMSRNGQTAWDILPNGMIRQVGTVTLTPVGNFNAQVLGGVTYYTHYYRVNFPRQFPNAQIATLATLASYSFSTQSSMAGKSLATHRDTDSGTDVSRTRFTVSYTTPNLGEIPTLHFEAIGY
ncbi:TPA: tail fiber protein [Escherichia coli]|uniref:tail fiber protein n=1 Tax=Escherichia coli TaxID=562 RepID=UPI002040F6DD|nr:tail fiber protein [Escherichia coli]MDW4867528.1 tail fiber protein [Escherichia coli]